MSNPQMLEAGKISTTHGVRGAVRILPWADSAEFLLDINRFYIEGEEAPRRVLTSSVHKTQLLCTLEGVDTLEHAIRLRGKTIFINRGDVALEEGRHFVQDIIGLEVRDRNLGVIGKVTDVLQMPAQDVYVVHGELKYMIPVVPDFVKKVDVAGGFVEVETIEGMGE